MWRRLALLSGLGAVLVVLWALNCTGPQPAVAGLRATPPATPGAPWRIEAEIENRGRGEGEIAIELRLRERQTGRTVATECKVQLDPHERTTLLVELLAPLGDYTPEAKVVYPPR